MIKKCEKEDEEIIYNYLEDCYFKSLYLYLNYDRYHFSNPDIQTFIQYDNNLNVTCLLLTFGSTLHVISKDMNIDILEVCSFINERQFSIICTDELIAKMIFGIYGKDTFVLSTGSVLELKKINKNLIVDDSIDVVRATEDDFKDIVDLLMSDDEKKKVYSRESLYNQIKQRNSEKYGRNYIIKKHNKVIAHAGTGAENSKIAVINSVIVNNDYRGKGFATIIVKKLCEDLLRENKICYLMVLEESVKRLYEKIGFYEKSTYGKLIRR